MAERKIVPACIVTDSEERKRRLYRVYTILLDLAEQQEAAEQAVADNEFSPVTEGTLAVGD